MDKFITKGKKRLRYGYTTGSCAAAAARAAAVMLLSGVEIPAVILHTPKGWDITIPISEYKKSQQQVCCAVKKDSGDDPDITNGILIYATVKKLVDPGIVICGGEGVGTVTRKGLAVAVGQPAINPVPLQMIREELEKTATEYHYSGGFWVEISAPAGVEIAQKTFNPRLGIKGGISILGTTGIVEPMSEEALVESLRIEMRVLREQGQTSLLFCPGNYGTDFATTSLGLAQQGLLKISNYLGYMLDAALELGFKKILLVGHAGKLVKVAAGAMHTHSRYTDGRMEVLAAYAAKHGASQALVTDLLSSITTDEAIERLERSHLTSLVFNDIVARIEYHLKKRVYDEISVGAVIFTKVQGLLAIGEVGQLLLNDFKEKEDCCEA